MSASKSKSGKSKTKNVGIGSHPQLDVAEMQDMMSRLFPQSVLQNIVAPERPTERSKRSIVVQPTKSAQEQKQQHVIYTYFNNTIYGILRSLKKKLPHNKKTYTRLRKHIQRTVAVDVTNPMTIWKKTVVDHEDVLREFNEENVKKFHTIAKQVPLLDALEIEQNWVYFTMSDLESLWGHFSQLFLASDLEETVGVDLMTQIQNLTGKLELEGKIDMSKPIDLASASVILGEAIDKDSEIKASMEKLNEKLAAVKETVVEPPTYAKRMERARNQED